MSKKETVMTGTLIEASDTALMANLKDGRERPSHQLITLLLDQINKDNFNKLRFAKRIEIRIIE